MAVSFAQKSEDLRLDSAFQVASAFADGAYRVKKLGGRRVLCKEALHAYADHSKYALFMIVVAQHDGWHVGKTVAEAIERPRAYLVL